MKFYIVVRKLPAAARSADNNRRFETRSEAEEYASALCRNTSTDYIIMKTEAEVCLQKPPVEIFDL